MKKIISLVMAFITLFIIAGCTVVNNEQTAANEPKQEVEQAEVAQPEEQQEVVQPENNDNKAYKELSGYSRASRVSERTIYVNYSDEKGKYEKACGDYYRNMDASLTAFVYNIYDEVETLDGVFESVMPKFVVDAGGYSEGILSEEEYEITSSENTTVAGYDSIKFTGKIKNVNGWDCHIYGYTFLFDKTPVAVIGLVSHKEQDPELIASVDREVDDMVQTIRTEK